MIKCPFCNSDSVKVHSGTRDNKDIDVYKCMKCETKFLGDLKSDIDYEAGEMYENHILNSKSIEERIKEFVPDTIRRVKLTSEMCKGKDVLDFGCGFGEYLSEIKKISNFAVGVELGKEERDYCLKNDIEVYKDIDEFDRTFDVITLFHVFEHLKNPNEWLNKFFQYQKRGGLLILEVPNSNDALIELYKCKAFEDFTYWSAHLYLYSEKSLTDLIESSNLYEIVDTKQVQRYSIANYLMWLSKGKPGGHKTWNFIDSNELNHAYENKLQELGMCDTLFYVLKRK